MSQSSLHHRAESSPEPGPPTDLGARIRALRELYGLSQRELAKRSGVTNGMVSLVEQNRVSPSVASLKKLLDGFPLSMGEFFTFDFSPRSQLFYRKDELTPIAGDRLEFRQVGSREDRLLDGQRRKLQVLHERYEPGGDTGESMLAHEGEESGVVVEGEIEVTVGGEKRVLSPGDAYYFDSRLPHRFRNTGKSVCVLVSVCTPPTF
jgi:transcriptional regulator with XRE-family HTH domain